MEAANQSLFVEKMINDPMLKVFTHPQKQEIRNLFKVRLSFADAV
jgi:hypothetical protein